MNKFKEIIKNKRNIKSLLLIVASIIVITGITYSSFLINITSETIISAGSGGGAISLTYSEQNTSLEVEDTGLSISEGKVQTNYFEFTVSSTSAMVYDLNYRIYLTTDSSNTLNNDRVYVYLTEVSGSTETQVSEPMILSSLTSHPTYSNSYILERNSFNFTSSTSTTKSKTYRLRVWADFSDIPSSTSGDVTTYSLSGGTFNYTVNVDTYNSNLLYDVMADNADTTTTPNFQYINNYNTDGINTNDSGVFLYNGTDNNGGNKNVYYYRGNVTNNNVLFGGFCWKMIRSTSTGGVKLIYNGVASSGTCNNTGTSSQITSTSTFNTYDASDGDGSPAFAGYMYGTVFYNLSLPVYLYASNSTYSSVTFYFGKTVTYSNGTYTLNTTTSYTGANLPSNLSTISSDGYYYTCLNSTTCSTVYYITDYDNTTNYEFAMVLPLTGGDTIATAFDKMLTNTNNSAAKTAIDTWYSTNLSSYSSYLENTVFCNDRSFASGTYGGNIGAGMTAVSNKTSKNNVTPLQNNNLIGTQKNNSIKFMGAAFSNGEASLYSGAFSRIYSFSPSLACTNQNDRFTLSTSYGGTEDFGNNALTYPVGLITIDEVNMAGGADENSNYYLYTGSNYWTMTPVRISYQTSIGMVESEGNISTKNIKSSYGLRPVVSLKPGTEYSSGNGTTSSPYVID